LEILHGEACQRATRPFRLFLARRLLRPVHADEGHLARTIEYVERNPVKAGLVEIASD
jgi:hypothetical protein